MFKWKSEYETGIKLIDEQHKKLFEIANRVYELLMNDLYVDKYDMIIEVINELKDYTVYHFQTEEEYMIRAKYKKFFSHKAEHDEFIKKVKEVDLYSIDNMQNQYLLELLNFIVEWIEKHILEVDKQLSKTIIP
ncbi:MAG: hemerythrin family protein [Clostridiaceae bacterium]|nr:hemerythrin family protein [Clostridiaceae bacterium]